MVLTGFRDVPQNQRREQISKRLVQGPSSFGVEHVNKASKSSCKWFCNRLNGLEKKSIERFSSSTELNKKKSRENVRPRWSAKGFVKRNFANNEREGLESTSVKVNK